jgi:hypothetical protein
MPEIQPRVPRAELKPRHMLEMLADKPFAADGLADPGTIHPASNKRYGVCVTLPSKWPQVAEAISKAAGGRLSARVRGSSKVALSAYEGEDGRLLVHLVNYAAPQATPPLTVELGKAWRKARAVRLLDVDAGEKTLPIRTTETGAVVEVRSLGVHGILVVE